MLINGPLKPNRTFLVFTFHLLPVGETKLFLQAFPGICIVGVESRKKDKKKGIKIRKT